MRTIDAFHAEDGHSTVFALSGYGPGLHDGYVRFNPNDREWRLRFDGDSHELRLDVLATDGVVSIAGEPELRFSVAELGAEHLPATLDLEPVGDLSAAANALAAVVALASVTA